jgi:hypothetical protein
VENSEPTSISISWQPPTLTSLQVFYYIISANNLNSSTVVGDSTTQVNTTTNVMLYNVTGLLPGTTYELTVVAVSRDIYGSEVAISQPSSSVTNTTGFTGTALILCMYMFVIVAVNLNLTKKGHKSLPPDFFHFWMPWANLS